MTVTPSILTIPKDVRTLILNYVPLITQARMAQECKTLQKDVYAIEPHKTAQTAFKNISVKAYTRFSKEEDKTSYENRTAPYFFISTYDGFSQLGGNDLGRVKILGSGFKYSDTRQCEVVSRDFFFNKKTIQAKHSYKKETLEISLKSGSKHTYKNVNDIASFGHYLLIAKDQGLLVLEPSTMKSFVLATAKFQRLYTDEKTGKVYGLKSVSKHDYEILDFSDPAAKSSIKDNLFVDALIKTAVKVKEWGSRFIKGFVFGFKLPLNYTNKFILGCCFGGTILATFIAKAITVSLLFAAFNTLIVAAAFIGFFLTMSLIYGLGCGIINSSFVTFI